MTHGSAADPAATDGAAPHPGPSAATTPRAAAPRAAPTVVWFFDVVSPFAALQRTQLARVEAHAPVVRRPVLFAGLLDRWGQLGPAEIAPKRGWTFRHVAWLARRMDVPLRMPAMHPFDPLPLLRLSIVLGDAPAVVDRLFDFVWRDGRLPSEADAWRALLDELGVEPARLVDPAVEAALHANGAAAVAAGVFGVPTAVVDGTLFWGLDATDMLIDHLAGSPVFSGDAMRAALALPHGPDRPKLRRPHAAP